MEASENSIPVVVQIVIFALGGFLFVATALIVSKFIRPDRPNAQKLMTYESGEMPSGMAWIQFNMRFYVLALVFLLFEIEIVFMFPWATVLSDRDLNAATMGSWSWYAYIEMLIFVLILVLGLAYVWKNKHLDWVKSYPETKDIKSPVPKDVYDQINQQYQSSKSTLNQ